MAECIILKGGNGADLDVVTAGKPDVLVGKVIVDKDGEPLTGTMPNNGAVSQMLNAGGSYTVPTGYHNGSGKVTANSLASQTSGTATAAQVLSGQTAWVNGGKITGTMANRGQAQYGASWGATSDYYAINSIPEGAYYKNGADWAPEARITKDKVRSGLGISSDKIKSGQQIADVWGNVVENKYFRQEIGLTGIMAFQPEGYGNTIIFGYVQVYTGIDHIQSLYIEKKVDLPVRTAYNGTDLVSTKIGSQYAYYFHTNSLNILFGSTIRIPVDAGGGTFVVLVTGY